MPALHSRVSVSWGLRVPRGRVASGEGPVSPPLGSFCPPAWPGLLHTRPQEPSPTLRGGREGRRAPGHRGSRRWGAGVGGVWTCCLRSSLGRGFPASVGGGEGGRDPGGGTRGGTRGGQEPARWRPGRGRLREQEAEGGGGCGSRGRTLSPERQRRRTSLARDRPPGETPSRARDRETPSGPETLGGKYPWEILPPPPPRPRQRAPRRAGTRTDCQRTTPPRPPGRPRSDKGLVRARATSSWLGAMGTRAPQGLLLLLLLRLLLPRGASAGNLHSPGESRPGEWAEVTLPSSASAPRTRVPLARGQSRWWQQLSSPRAPWAPGALAGEPGGSWRRSVG